MVGSVIFAPFAFLPLAFVALEVLGSIGNIERVESDAAADRAMHRLTGCCVVLEDALSNCASDAMSIGDSKDVLENRFMIL